MDDREEMRRLIDMIEKSAGSNTIEQAVDDLKTFANTASFLANKLDSRLKAGDAKKKKPAKPRQGHRSFETNATTYSKVPQLTKAAGLCEWYAASYQHQHLTSRL